MFSEITNIYNKKTKGPTLMELFTVTWKLEKFFLTTRDIRCVHHGWHGTHRYDIQVLSPHTRQVGCIDILHCCNDPCLKALKGTWISYRCVPCHPNIVSMCAVSPVVHTSNISSCQNVLVFSNVLSFVLRHVYSVDTFKHRTLRNGDECRYELGV
jgi:hypothetical protein